MREKRRDDFFRAAKLLMSMTFAARTLFAPDNVDHWLPGPGGAAFLAG